MRLLALVVPLTLLVSACGDDGDDDGSTTEVCDRLPIEVASRVVGVEYSANGQSAGICYYQRPGTDQAFGLRVIAYQDDFDQVVSDSEDLGYRARPVDVPGADRAVALSGQLRSIVAEQDGDAFEVALNADASVATRVMTVVLGGEAELEPRPVASPCGSLPRSTVRRVLGVPTEAKPGARDVAMKSCTWRARGRELVVAAATGRGPVGEFWDENFFVGEGVEPTRVRVPGADGALLVSARRDETVGVAVARGNLSYAVTVAGPVDPRAAAIGVATALLARR